jgi:hypothetical protein
MPATVISICNRALGALGVKRRITSLSETTTEAKECAERWEEVRDRLFGAYDWRWARRHKALTALEVDAPEDWALAYALPEDCVEPRSIWPGTRNPRADQRIPFESRLLRAIEAVEGEIPGQTLMIPQDATGGLSAAQHVLWAIGDLKGHQLTLKVEVEPVPVYEVTRSNPETNGYEVEVGGRCVGDHVVVFTALSSTTFKIAIDGITLMSQVSNGNDPLEVPAYGFGPLPGYPDYTVGFGWLLVWIDASDPDQTDAIVSLDGLRWTIAPPGATYVGETYTFNTQPRDHGLRLALAVDGIPKGYLRWEDTLTVHNLGNYSSVLAGVTLQMLENNVFQGMDINDLCNLWWSWGRSAVDPGTDVHAVLTDAADAQMLYTRRIEDPGLWPSWFQAAASWALAADLAMPLSVDPKLRQVALMEAQRLLLEAVSYDQRGMHEDELPDNEFLASRR